MKKILQIDVWTVFYLNDEVTLWTWDLGSNAKQNNLVCFGYDLSLLN